MSRDKFHLSADRMKKVREGSLRLSQQEVADQIGVPVHRIKDVEVGKTKISVELALLLEDKFNLSFRWLLTGVGSMTRTEEIPVPVGRSHVDANALQQIIAAVEDGLMGRKIVLDPSKKARLILLLYEYSIETGKEVEAELVDKYLELIA